MSEYLDFYETLDTGKTKVWTIISKTRGSVLGQVKWHGPWRQYTFWPSPETIWNVGCLADVQRFINDRMAERRANLR